MIRNRRIVGLMVVALLVIAVRMVNAPVSYSQGGPKRPNILVIFGRSAGVSPAVAWGIPPAPADPSCGVGYTVGVTNLKGNK